MVIVTKFDIGDTVRCGPISEAFVTGIQFHSTITYEITYWHDEIATNYTAWDWELALIEKSKMSEGTK